jgi:4-amino-4-deoxy-L-arabinose transferase-like glycosyltransferase
MSSGVKPFVWLAALCANAFRVAALFVALLVLIFPAFKGVWLGYVPLIAGAAAWWGFLRWTRGGGLGWLERIGPKLFLLLLIGAPALVMTLLIVGVRSEPTFDGLFVIEQARALLRTGSMDPLTYYAPGQIWYTALFFRLFGDSYLVAQLMQIPLAVLVPFLIYRMGRRMMSEPQARLAALLVACYPGYLLYVLVTPYYYYMYTLMMMLVVLAWLRMADETRQSPWAGIYGGAAAGWGALTKATMLVAPLQGLTAVLLISGRLPAKKQWFAWLLFVGMMVVSLWPWVQRNTEVFGEPVLICTSGPLVFYSANNPESDGLYSDIPDRASPQSPQDMLEHMAWCKQQGWDFIRSEPLSFLRLVGLKLLHTWGTETTFVELINHQGGPLGVFDRLLRLIVQCGWAALVFAWAAVAWDALRRRSKPRVLEVVIGILVLSKFLIYSVYEGGSRHHMPVIPLLWLYVILRHRKQLFSGSA